MKNDEKIQDIAIGMIRRSSKKPEEWRWTVIGEIISELEGCLSLDPGELPLVTAFLSESSWYSFTTRRIISHFAGNTHSLDPASGITIRFGNFKGIGGTPSQVATIFANNSEAQICIEYETGPASMAPIYASKYWNQKHPILHKLLTSAEREAHRASRSSNSN